MFASPLRPRKTAARIVALLSLIWLAACESLPTATTGGAPGPAIDPSAPVQVALLVPRGSATAADNFLSQNLENAARLAISDLSGAEINLRVYNTGGNAAQAAAVATQAVAEGAQVILGPLYAEAANAAGVAVADRGVNVLAFSNNASIAGGNVFVLGPTFRNTADRLVDYALARGTDEFLVVHGEDLQGSFGRSAIESAIAAHGGRVTGVQSYPLAQTDIARAASRIAASVEATGAEAIFMTAGVNADLPVLATALPEAGLDPARTQYIGLTRWDAAPQALALPGLQGGLFAIPDQQMTRSFEARYAAAYGEAPHPLAGLAYDGIAAIGALVAGGDRNALSRAALTQASGFQGTGGVFRLLPDGTNERALAVAQVRNNQVVVVDPAPRSFGRAGF